MIAPCENFGGEATQSFRLSNEQRQAIILAVARLSVERPGMHSMLREIAGAFSGAEMFDAFRMYAGLPPMVVVDSSNAFGVVRGGDTIRVMHWDKVGREGFTLMGAVTLSVWMAKLADPRLVLFHRMAKEIEK